MVKINPCKLKQEIENRKKKPNKYQNRAKDDGKEKHRVAAELLGYLRDGYTMSEILFEDEQEKNTAEAVMPYVEMVYKNYVSVKRYDHDVSLLIEYPVEIPDLGTKGVIDAAIVAPEALIVYDLKTGYGPVPAKEFREDALVYNRQLMSYLLALSHLYPVPDTATCTGTISQPGIHHTDTFAVTLAVVKSWALSMQQTLSMEKIRGYYAKAVEDMTDEERIDILQAKKGMMKKCEEIEQYYIEKAEAGEEIPEEIQIEHKYKRVITDEEKALQILTAAGYPYQDICKLRGILDLEKVVTKEKLYESLGEIIAIYAAPGHISLRN